MTKLSLLVLGLTGVFSFCFAHETLAQSEHTGGEQMSAVSELHDTCCGSEVTVDKFAPSKNPTLQSVHNYFPVIALLGNNSINLRYIDPPSFVVLPRGKPPSLQPDQLQVFRC